jgi:hypothetical protein
MSQPTTEMQFGTLDDYIRIVQWMKDCGSTHALAGEVTYHTPIILIQSPQGTAAAEPGDWIVRGDDGCFRVRRAEVELQAPTTVTTAEELAALPCGTVLLDTARGERSAMPWVIVPEFWRGEPAILGAGDDHYYRFDDPASMRIVLAEGPFTVLLSPPAAALPEATQ